MPRPTDSFENMMRAQGPRVYTLAIRLCGNETDGSDLAQEVFLKAWEHWESFRGDSDVSTWLYRICMNTWKNRVRSEKRRFFWKHFSLNSRRDGEDDEPSMDLPHPEAPAGTSIEKSDEQEQLRRALATLDPEDRALLVMREMEDRSYEEIAEYFEVPIGTVRSRLSRSREKLAQAFERIGNRR